MHLRATCYPIPICHYNFICYCMTTSLHVQLGASRLSSYSFFFMLCFVYFYVYLNPLQFQPIVQKLQLILLIFTRVLLIFPLRLRVCLLICRALLPWLGSYLNSESDRLTVPDIFHKQQRPCKDQIEQ